jgi:hypothetical protein
LLTWADGTDRFLGEWHEGLGFFVYPTKRFKTVTIHAAWIRELTVAERALGATAVQVLRQGTTTMPSRTLMETRLEDLYGAGFRADVAKMGDKQLLSFHITVANGEFLPGKPDTVAQALDFLVDVLDRPHMIENRFPDAVVEQEKSLVKRQIAAIINDKGQYAMSRLIELVADGQRFGLRKLGTVDEVDVVTAKDLTDFFHRVHDESPFVFTVIGDVDVDLVQAHIAFQAADPIDHRTLSVPPRGPNCRRVGRRAPRQAEYGLPHPYHRQIRPISGSDDVRGHFGRIQPFQAFYECP